MQMKKIISLLLALALCLALLSAAALAEQEPQDVQEPQENALPEEQVPASDGEGGSCGDSVTWTLEDGVLTISGTGPMDDQDWGEAPWYPQCESITRIVVENGVTAIGALCFWNLEQVTSVSIADSVTYIGEHGMSYLTSLKAMSLPAGLTSFGLHAFGGCEALETLVLPEGLTVISEAAFTWNQSLIRIYIPASVTRIEEYAFSDCLKLLEIFYGGTQDQWEAIELAPQLDDDGTDCMAHVMIHYGSSPDEIRSAPIPTPMPTPTPAPVGVVAEGICGKSGITYNGKYDDSLIPSEPWSVEWSDAIRWTLTSDGKLTLRGTGMVPHMVQMVFSNGSYYTSPWFKYASQITELVVEEGVTSFGNCAFAGLYGLKTVRLPASISTMFERAFQGCDSIKDVYTADSESTWQWMLDNKLIDTKSPLRKATVHYGVSVPTATPKPAETPEPTPVPLTPLDAAKLLQDIVKGNTKKTPADAAEILKKLI